MKKMKRNYILKKLKVTQRLGRRVIVRNATDLRVLSNTMTSRGSASLQPLLRWRQGKSSPWQFITMAIPLIDFVHLMAMGLTQSVYHIHTVVLFLTCCFNVESNHEHNLTGISFIAFTSPLGNRWHSWGAPDAILHFSQCAFVRAQLHRLPHLFPLFRLVTHVSHWINSSDKSVRPRGGRISL